MGKAPTVAQVIDGIEIQVPTGSLNPPCDRIQWIAEASYDPANWKLPTRPYYTYDKSIAEDLAYCYDWFLGGHELEIAEYTKYGALYRVSSKGYYHYVGS